MGRVTSSSWRYIEYHGVTLQVFKYFKARSGGVWEVGSGKRRWVGGVIAFMFMLELELDESPDASALGQGCDNNERAE